MDAPMFERVYSVTADGNVPVTKYKSKRTGLSLCIAQVEGPLVNGYFCLGTEAHDDDGLPHTLEHLVFLGSEDYPYKGVLDLLANRCLASGTNAWTDTDHTCYTMTNAGSEGFLNLLPIYLDHILYPTLTAAGYTTEVHHINEAGENAGVVYCEMQARENSGESRTHLECQREMYPGHCGYRSETGGIMANLRDSTSHTKVCAYHGAFYRPDNLCLIITGQINHEDVFRALQPIEEKILSKGKLPAFTRPWQSTVPPLGGSVNKVVRYSADDETHGMVNVSWRGPAAKDQYTYASLNVLFDYLSESAISPLQRDFVEIDDPFCSKVSCTMVENAECCIMVRFSNVFKEKLHLIQPRLTGVLQKIGFGDEKLDMARMSNLLHRRVLDSLAGIEDTPHQLLANYLIGDFLFGDDEDDLKSRVNTVPALQQMKIEKETYWVNLINKYMIGKQSVVIIGEPSSTLREEMAKTEKERVAKQHESLGEKGLKEKGEILQQATEANEKEPPETLLTSVDVPDVATIFFHPIKRFCNRTADNRNYSAVTENADFSLDKIPFKFQLDDIHSSFVKMNVLLDSSTVPQELKFYLPLFCQVLFESPVLRDGVLISHEEVIAQLEADTLDTGACVGVSGSKFNPGSFPQIINIVVKVEQEKFVKGVQWLKDIMFNTKLVADRLKVVAKRLNSDIATYKRKGQQVVKTLMTNLVFAEDCNLHVSSILRQNRFLEQTLKLLETEPELIESKVEEVRRILTSRDNITVHMSANVAQLTAKGLDPQSAWATAFPEETQEVDSSIKMKKTFEYIVPISDCDKTSVIAGVGSVESSFLVQVAPCVNTYSHDDLAPIMVFIQYVTQLEGPMWRQIRGLGLSYHYSMYTSVETGLLYFILARSTHIVNAYKEGRDIVMGYLNGTTEFTDVELESAKSSLTFEIIETETTVSDVSHQSLLAYFKGVSQTYNKEFLKKISKVTIADLQNVGVQYISALFDGQIRRAVCCNTSKVEDIVKDFKEIGVELTALPSLDEDFLCCVPTSS